MRKWWKWPLLALLALEVVYVAGTAIFLNAGFLTSLINENPDELVLDWKYALSPLPGLVVLEGFTLRLQDDDMQMWIDLGKARTTVNLFALLRREFHAQTVHGADVKFHLRMLRPEKEVVASDYETLPPIPGFPFFLKKPKKPDEGPGNPFKVRIGGIDLTNLNEVWIEKYRYNGSIDVNGGFFIHPKNQVHIDSSVIKTSNGAVKLGKDVVAENIKGAISCLAKPFRNEESKGLDIFNFFSCDIGGSAKVGGLSFLNNYFGKLPWLKLEEGIGELKNEISLRDGVFQPGSFLEVQSSRIDVRLWKQQAVGEGRVYWRVDKDKQSRLDVAFRNYRLRRPSDGASAISGKDLKLAVTSANTALSKPFTPLKLRLEINDGKVEDLKYLNTYFPKGSRLKLLGGTGTINGIVNASTNSRDHHFGNVSIKGKGFRLSYEQLLLTGNFDLVGKLNNGNITVGDLEVSGSKLRLSEVLAEVKGQDPATVKGWWGELSLPKASFQIGDDRNIEADIVLKGMNARPATELFAAKGTLPGILTGIFEFDGLEAGLHLSIGERRLAIDRLLAKGGPTTLQGWYHRGDSKRAALLVEYGPIAAGLEIKGDETSFRVNDPIGWYKRATAENSKTE